ncbi:transposable element Tcb2 transposase [Trichonephila clavipes]|nr:transposable element Tcb2 transposase [Trichonephila clavipes]
MVYSNRATSAAGYCGQTPSKSGLFTHCPEWCILLKVGNRQHRLEWCKEHKNWTSHQWSRVLFTDESRFSATSDSQRHLIWKKRLGLGYGGVFV